MLVCVDGSAASDAVVTWGTREAVMRQLPKILYSSVVATLIDASKDAWMVAKGWATSRYCSAQIAFRTRHLRHLRTTSTEHPACPKWGVIGPTIRATLLASELPTTAS